MSAGKDQTSHWKVHDEAFGAILGTNPSLELILSVEKYPFAHEAGVFFPSADGDELFITSNQFHDDSGVRKIQISKISIGPGKGSTIQEEIKCDEIQMGNGGVNYKGGILFCAQGSMTQPSGLYLMARTLPYATEPVVTSFYGRPFNSVNDVVIHSDGSIWFTDPPYGHIQGYRPQPSLPSQVYRFDPANSSIRAVADGFGRPNGICFAPDESIVYVTDTDQLQGDGSIDYSRVSTMYAMCQIAKQSRPANHINLATRSTYRLVTASLF